MVFKKKYLVKNKWLYLGLFFVDFFTFFLKKKTSKNIFKNIKKILISNIAHLGDVTIATGILPILKEVYPNIKIGFLCSSFTQDILKNHPLVDKIYTFDHFKLSRKNISIFEKIKIHFNSKCKAVKEISEENYDLAVDLYHYFPNSSHLLYKTKIPHRIGYSSGGFSNFFTKKVSYANFNKNISSLNLNLLGCFNRWFLMYGNPRPSLNLIKSSLSALHEGSKLRDYFIIHMGSGDQNKEPALHFWKKLINDAKIGSCKGCFTGKGEKENKNINLIIQNSANFLDFSNKLDFYQLINFVKNSRFVICVDSFILHVAHAFNKKTVCLFSDINNSEKWCPKSENVKLVKFNKKKMENNKEYFHEIQEKVKQEIKGLGERL